MTSTSHTLAQRISTGRLPVSEGLHLATQIADQLRQWHARESVHGALTPSAVSLADGAVALLGADAAHSKWAYEAPEVKLGQAADVRSDIFSFGAIMFEMLTGESVFVEGPALGFPLATGHAGIDRLVNGCVAPSPDSRFQELNKVMLELRRLNGTGKRSRAVLSAAPRVAALVPVAAPRAIAAPEPPPSAVAAPAPVDQNGENSATQALAIQDFEGRISARLHEQERTIANVADVANELLKALREQQAATAAATAAAQAAAVAAPRPVPVMAEEPAPQMRGMGFRTLDELSGLGSRTDKMLDLLSDKLSRLDLVVTSMTDRVQKLEDIFDQFDTDAAALRDSVTRDIRIFEKSLKSQGAAIESARTAMGQTDDLVERVVEALDSLQAMFVSSGEEQMLAS